MLRIIITAFCLLATGAVGQDGAPLSPNSWNAVGRVDLGSGGYCTGVLIAPDVVLTAAHCLYDKRNGAKFDLNQLSFRVGRDAGHVLARQRISQTLVHPSYKPARKGELTNLKHDVALLKLTTGVAAANATPMQVAAPDVGGSRAHMLSFGGVHSETAQIQSDCNLTRHREGVLLTSCQAQLGTSGAPVIQMRQGKPHIVSIVSAKARADQQPVALVVSVADALQSMHRAMGLGFIPAQYVTP